MDLQNLHASATRTDEGLSAYPARHVTATPPRPMRLPLAGMFRMIAAGSVLPELAAILCFLALLWTSIGLALSHEYTTDWTAAQHTTQNLVRAFQESMRRTISQIDQVLLSARAFYGLQGARLNFNEWARTQTLPDTMTAAIGLADATGHVFADTLPIPPNVSIADRPHFRAQLDPGRDELYISRPVHGRVSGVDTIQFTRRLLGPHGEFAGVAVFSLGCTALSEFYQTIDLGKGFVALLLDDGTILAHGPVVPGMVGRTFEDGRYAHALGRNDGTIVFMSRSSHVTQLASFRRLQDYPLIVMVGLDANTALAPYRALRRRAIAAGLFVTLAIGVIGVLWLQQKRRNVASRRALGVTLETISQGILMADPRGHVPVVNMRAMDLLGVADSTSPNARREALRRATAFAMEGSAGAIPSLPHRGGTARPALDNRFETVRDDGTVIEVRSHALASGGFVHTYTDVTEQRLADVRVRYLAHHDTLTGLANRTQLRQRLPDFLVDNEASGLLTGFMLIDLDGFKNINDTLGHDIGDELLVEVSRRLQGLVRQADFVARLGGDEFVVLLPGLRQAASAIPLAESVLQRLSEPAQIRDHRLRIGASIGLAFHPRDALDADTLFKHADIALYAAKGDGRGTFRCFDQDMRQTVHERRLLESGLRRALENNELTLHFQPLFSARSLQVTGFEALVRWRHPTRGYVSPEIFVRIAEECGLTAGPRPVMTD